MWRVNLAWTPIGAEKTASGYEVAWKNSERSVTVWNTDNNGNYVSNIGNHPLVSGTNNALKSFETSFNQDLNGDGHIGLLSTVIESRRNRPDSGCRSFLSL